jgi:tRNA U34 5-carboxymethylaminomethyl modifying enzyme MnmG/GidA
MFTPFKVQFTRDFERYFMKEKEYKLEEINEKQNELGLRDYEPGNILLIDFSKTGSRFAKKRRTFNKLARFISYDFRNVKYHVYNIEKHIKNPITIPIYYTKYIAENEKSIPDK